MAVLDGKDKTLTFDGELVGNITKYEFVDGETPDVIFRSLESDTPEYYAGLTNFGLLKLTLYRDLSDVGQIALESSRSNRRTRQCVLTLSDGSTRTFDAYVKSLPIVGSDDGSSPVISILRIASIVV